MATKKAALLDLQVYEALGDGDGHKRAYSSPPTTNFSHYARSTVETLTLRVEAIALSG
ncbi:hypothetical protein PI95_004220 [Hassallia byssoidea VB512170]|uniref:Uncharacterized protein n=1 Tax=Hassallia byssoidea VB512170 TaxID=1304833 RepID=A0A846H349_9CYAN|nr:hypothetical protein [Hassalia byssoidea]NEU71802.1 hypothetical protein [Hassalia byssoidea VB512170]